MHNQLEICNGQLYETNEFAQMTESQIAVKVLREAEFGKEVTVTNVKLAAVMRDA